MNLLMMLQESKMKEAGRDDANGDYGEYLLGLPSMEGLIVDYELSPTMEKLISLYDAECERLERNAWLTKLIVDRLLRRAINLTKKIRIEDNKIQSTVEEANQAEQKYREIEAKLLLCTKKATDTANVYRGDGADKTNNSSPEEMNAKIEEQKKEIEEKQRIIAGLRKGRKDLVENSIAKMSRSRIRYDRSFEKLNKKAVSIYRKYNYLLMIYWKELTDTIGARCRMRKKDSPVFITMTLKDYCAKKDVKIRGKDNILEADQSKVNACMKEMDGFREK